MMDEEVAWLKREAGSSGEATEADEGGSGSGGHTPDLQPVSSNISAAQTVRYGERFDARTAAPLNGHGNSNGDAVGTGDIRTHERNIMDFGLREQPSPSRADHYRLSHMANVALGAETGEQHQHSQNAVLRGNSAPRD